jgi:hypothetical protein
LKTLSRIKDYQAVVKKAEVPNIRASGMKKVCCQTVFVRRRGD